MAAPIVHDELPTLEDKLDWKSELDRLSSRILNCPAPHVLGIHGDWGSGKTSFMRQLQYSLGGEIPERALVSHASKSMAASKRNHLQGKIATIWFDAWQYQNEPVPAVALLQEMRRQLAGHKKLQEKFNKIGEVALRSMLDSFSDIGKAIGFEGIPSTDKIEKIGTTWEQNHHAQIMQVDSIRENLTKIIKCLLPSDDKNARVVVFIDDLDRCKPNAAIKLLEDIKIYFYIPNCVFILGMNERMLVDAIREEISAPADTTAEEMKLRASHYLEKICTDIYRLPLPENPTKLLLNWLENSNHRDSLRKALDKVTCLPPNPRRLKALANQWARFASYTQFPNAEKEQEIWAARVLIASYIHQFHRDLWERWHFQPDFWNEIKQWCLGAGASTSISATEIPASMSQGPSNSKTWSYGLKRTSQVDSWGDRGEAASWKSDYPNPGDIEIFWIDALIRKQKDYLDSKGFIPLLSRKV